MIVNNSKFRLNKPAFLIVVVFVGILINMFVANINSTLVNEIYIPLNEGVANLFTSQSSLIAVYRDNAMRIWNWNYLSDKPREYTLKSEQTVLFKNNYIISFSPNAPETIIVMDLQGKSERQIYINQNCITTYLRANFDGDAIIVVLEKQDNTTKACKSYEILNLDMDAFQLIPIEKIGRPETEYLFWDFAVSNDGNLLAMAGKNGDNGLVVLVDIKQKKTIWEKELLGTGRLPSVSFSSDDNLIYTRDAYRSIQRIETKTAEQLSPLLRKENMETLMSPSQSVQEIVVAPKGKLLAGVIGQCVEVWNLEKEEMIYTVGTNHKIISGVAFSPNSDFVATSDMRQGGKIQIWKLPKP